MDKFAASCEFVWLAHFGRIRCSARRALSSCDHDQERTDEALVATDATTLSVSALCARLRHQRLLLCEEGAGWAQRSFAAVALNETHLLRDEVDELRLPSTAYVTYRVLAPVYRERRESNESASDQ